MPQTNLRELVRKADPNWDKERLQPVAYEFSNGRKFKEPNPPFYAGTST